MVGEELSFTRLGSAAGGETLLSVESLSRSGSFEGVSLTLKRRMVIGFAGTVGSGRARVLRSVGGIEPADSGRILFSGEDLAGRPLAEFIRHGVCFVPPGMGSAFTLALPLLVS